MKQLKFISHLLSALAVAGCMASCNDDNETTVVPDNWINLSTNTLSAAYTASTLELPYTLAGGLAGNHVYVVCPENSWATAYIEQPGTIKVEVPASRLVAERTQTLSVCYDADHTVDFTVKQEAAPEIAIERFDFSALPTNIGLCGNTSLEDLLGIYPPDATVTAADLIYTVEAGDENGISIENGILNVLVKGTYTISVTSPDYAAVSGQFTITAADDYLERMNWSVTTSRVWESGNNYMVDGATGLPEHLIDGDEATYLSMLKPGKSNYSNGGAVCSTPADHQLSFTIDCGAPVTFNAFAWRHRTVNNITVGLRVDQITLYGSMDGENFTQIGGEFDLEGNNTNGDTPESIYSCGSTVKYRYVKAVYGPTRTDNGNSGGNTWQVAEFKLLLQ